MKKRFCSILLGMVVFGFASVALAASSTYDTTLILAGATTSTEYKMMTATAPTNPPCTNATTFMFDHTTTQGKQQVAVILTAMATGRTVSVKFYHDNCWKGGDDIKLLDIFLK